MTQAKKSTKKKASKKKTTKKKVINKSEMLSTDDILARGPKRKKAKKPEYSGNKANLARGLATEANKIQYDDAEEEFYVKTNEEFENEIVEKRNRILGRPTDYDEEFHPVSAIDLGMRGHTISSMCAEWGTHRSNIYEWAQKHEIFRDALKKAKELRIAFYENAGRSLAMGNDPKYKNANPTIFIWMTKNCAGYSDKVEEIDPTEDQLDGLLFLDENEKEG